jgi:hypothetical protein
VKSNPFGIVGPKESKEYSSEVRFGDIVTSTQRALLVKENSLLTKYLMAIFKGRKEGGREGRGSTYVIKAAMKRDRNSTQPGSYCSYCSCCRKLAGGHFLAAIGSC